MRYSKCAFFAKGVKGTRGRKLGSEADGIDSHVSAETTGRRILLTSFSRANILRFSKRWSERVFMEAEWLAFFVFGQIGQSWLAAQ